MAMALLVIAAFASLLRGGRYVHEEQAAAAVGAQPAASGAQPAARDGPPATDGHPASRGQPANDSQPAANGGQQSSTTDRGEAPRARRGPGRPDGCSAISPSPSCGLPRS